MSFTYHDAYKIRGYVEYPMKSLSDPIDSYDDIEAIPAKIICMPLDRIRPHTKTTTKGAPGPKGKPSPPTIANATFRIEPAKVVQDGKFLCPSLAEALWPCRGDSRLSTARPLFVGPHYLSAITDAGFPGQGQPHRGRHLRDELASDGRPNKRRPNAEPAKQKLHLPLQRRRKARKVARGRPSGRSKVSCKKIKL